LGTADGKPCGRVANIRGSKKIYFEAYLGSKPGITARMGIKRGKL
jgi:hypothetical protein